MKKSPFLFILSWIAYSQYAAQTPCTQSHIAGVWKDCGIVQSASYSSPPTKINADSLYTAFSKRPTLAGRQWTFNADGTFLYEYPLAHIKDAGRYTLAADQCALKLSTRKKEPIIIVHLTDSSMIQWSRNPKAAYLTVYRR